MKKRFIFTLVFMVAAGIVYAEEGQIPAGMSVAKDGVIKVIVPEGAQSRQERNLTVYEGTDAYVSRSVMEMKQRLAAVEAKQDSLQQQMEQLKASLQQIQDKLDRFSFE